MKCFARNGIICLLVSGSKEMKSHNFCFSDEGIRKWKRIFSTKTMGRQEWDGLKQQILQQMVFAPEEDFTTENWNFSLLSENYATCFLRGTFTLF